MNKKLHTILLLIVFLTGSYAVQAQSLVIKLQDGSEKTELLTSIQKLSFVNGELNVSLKAGINEQFNLSDIQQAHFENVTAIQEPEVSTANRLKVYPNPASQEISIQNIPGGATTIFFYRMDGKLVKQIFSSSDSETINISDFKGGFYLLKAGNQTIKFIKL
jgi:hypothetical protein